MFPVSVETNEFRADAYEVSFAEAKLSDASEASFSGEKLSTCLRSKFSHENS